MSTRKISTHVVVPAIVFGLLFGLLSQVVAAQDGNLAKRKAEAVALSQQQKHTEALPLLEKLATELPDDAEIHRRLGFALLGQSKNVTDQAAAKTLRARARAAFVKARENGDNSPVVSGLIDSFPPDGGEGSGFSPNKKVEELMQKGEAAFTTGKMDEALKYYQEAYTLDPKQYHAALFSGDAYTQLQKYADAEIWYQKAIQIDPFVETAYRYSATPLMKQGKFEEAKDRYVEAWIVEPYSKFALQGLVQWGQLTKTRLAHPEIDVPKTTTGPDGKPKTTINVNTLADDGSMAWVAYSATRETWKKEKFAKTFPRDKEYRHSLAEETDALRSVVSTAKTLKAKTLHPHIALVQKLDSEGLLEAFVLISLPDRGIVQDHPAYLRSNREKLKRYVINYIIGSR